MADWTKSSLPSAWTDPSVDEDASAIHDYDDIAREARAACARRRASYPDLIKSGRLSVADARADLDAWQHIARDWRWIAFGEGEPGTVVTLVRRVAALDTAIGRWLEMVGEAGMNPQAYRQGQLLAAMRWWAEREYRRDPDVHHVRETAAVAHHWRRENGHPTRGEMLTVRALCPACERRASDPATTACTRTDCGLAHHERKAA